MRDWFSWHMWLIFVRHQSKSEHDAINTDKRTFRSAKLAFQKRLRLCLWADRRQTLAFTIIIVYLYWFSCVHNYLHKMSCGIFANFALAWRNSSTLWAIVVFQLNILSGWLYVLKARTTSLSTLKSLHYSLCAHLSVLCCFYGKWIVISDGFNYL